jgi:hypothetical protein
MLYHTASFHTLNSVPKVKCVYYSSFQIQLVNRLSSSIPTDNLIKSLVTPVAACSSTDSC